MEKKNTAPSERSTLQGEALLKQSGRLPRFRDDDSSVRASRPTVEEDRPAEAVTSQVCRRFDLREAADETDLTRPTARPRPGFVPVDPFEALATPRPKMPMSCTPRRLIGDRELTRLPLDHRTAFVLMHIDGRTSLRELVDLTAIVPDELTILLRGLVELGAITLA